jgi:hypothetical protein
VPAAIWARIRSQISSKARRVWIGANTGAPRGTAAAAAVAAAGAAPARADALPLAFTTMDRTS